MRAVQVEATLPVISTALPLCRTGSKAKHLSISSARSHIWPVAAECRMIGGMGAHALGVPRTAFA